MYESKKIEQNFYSNIAISSPATSPRLHGRFSRKKFLRVFDMVFNRRLYLIDNINNEIPTFEA